uniref:Transporter n=1 Tax=Parastrongyloides trichosuri TaxID=131310 RepID=A0A0N4ZY73_PARTI
MDDQPSIEEPYEIVTRGFISPSKSLNLPTRRKSKGSYQGALPRRIYEERRKTKSEGAPWNKIGPIFSSARDNEVEEQSKIRKFLENVKDMGRRIKRKKVKEYEEDRLVLSIPDGSALESLLNKSVIDDSEYNFIFTKKFFQLASSVGIMLGLGNVWRFPKVVYENGGGTFIVVYLILCIIVGFPAAYMEGLLGQFSKSTPSFAFNKIVPIMQGLGWTGVFINMTMTAIYGVILSWITIYFGISIISKHRMIFSCKNSYNSNKCFSIYDNRDCISNHHPNVKERFSYNESYFLPDGNQGGECKFTKDQEALTDIVRTHYNGSYQSSGKEFFEKYILDRTYDLNKVGDLNGTIFITVALILVFTCFIITRESNKYKYFGNGISVASSIATFAFMATNVRMEGSELALSQYVFNFDYNYFFAPKTWVNAAAQLCYSMSIAEGSYISLTSKNKKKSNIYKETIVITICDVAMSLICTVAFFSVLGHLAFTYKITDINEIVEYGAILMFIALPDGLTQEFAGNVYMLIFFAFLFVLIQSSLVYYIESIVFCIMEQFKSKKESKGKFTKLIIICLFMLSLPMTFGNGIFWVVAFDDASTTVLPILALIEIGTVSYFYGIDRWILDIKTVLSRGIPVSPSRFGSSGTVIRLLWKYVTPISLLLICLGAVYKIISEPFTLGSYEMPNLVTIVAWIVAISPFSFTFGFALFKLLKVFISKEPLPRLVKIQPEWPTYNQDYQCKTKDQIMKQRQTLDDRKRHKSVKSNYIKNNV